METARRIAEINKELRRGEHAEILHRDTHAWAHMISMLMDFAGLRGLWTANHRDVNGNWEDWTKYDLLLSMNGSIVEVPSGGAAAQLIPYLSFSGPGSGDYFSRADGPPTSITGTETTVHGPQRGLTLGGWAYSTDIANQQGFITKWAGAGSRSYVLSHYGNVAGDPVGMVISDDGTNSSVVYSNSAYQNATWHWVVGRFCDNDTGEELAIWLDGEKTTAATARASIFDSASNFNIGARNGTILFSGRMAVAFLCAAKVPDVVIEAAYQQSRAAFGV